MIKNLKIGKRLIAAFIAVALIAGAAGLLGVWLFAKTDSDYSYALENYGFASGKIGMFSAEINVNRAHIRDIVLLTDRAQLEAANAAIQESVGKVNTLMNEIRATNTSDEAKALFATIETNLADYRGSRDKVIELGMANKQDEAYALLMAEAAPKLTKISEDTEALYQMNLAAGQKTSDDLTDFGNVMLVVMIACILVGYALALVFALYISRGISRPLVEIERGAQHMAQGNFDTQITYQSRDEVGSLADSMRQMITTTKAIIEDVSGGLNKLADGDFDVSPTMEYIGVYKQMEVAMCKIIHDLNITLAQIKMSAEQVSSGSDQVSSGAQALAQGATEQASSVEELSASISEVSQQIRDNAGNAAAASDVVNTVGATIAKSNQQMTQMMDAMSDISESSSQISKIIKTIEDIAFQTNILALNAAVEAARAGAAGKGFAVVADEVRNLSTKSSEAAKQTNVLIESSVKSVNNGVKIATETAKSLSEVVVGAEEVTSLITKISQASGEQSISITQINQGIEQISSVVQTNSATSEESAAASEELNGQANMMKTMIAKFRLKNETAQTLTAPADNDSFTGGYSHTSSGKY